jgi:hypothetical protein
VQFQPKTPPNVLESRGAGGGSVILAKVRAS